MRKKRVILNLMLGRGVGGLEAVFVRHAINFRELGYRSIAVCHPRSHYIAELRRAGIEVFTMGNRRINIFAWMKWIRILRRVRPDVVCMHGNRAIEFGIARWLRLAVRPFPRLMATTHNARNKHFRHLDGCFAITQVLKDSLTKDFGIPPSKVFYCPNATSRPQASFDRIRHEPFTIGFLGRFHSDKGGDFLLEACSILKREGVPFRLEMAGAGALREQYEKFAEEHRLQDQVNFCGWVEEEDKPGFFGRIDILCLPSRREGMPVVLLEGLSYATPLVVSSCPGMVEVLERGRCGIVFPIGDVSALASALKTMAFDVNGWKTFSQNAVSLHRDGYTVERQCEFLEKGVEAVCGR